MVHFSQSGSQACPGTLHSQSTQAFPCNPENSSQYNPSQSSIFKSVKRIPELSFTEAVRNFQADEKNQELPGCRSDQKFQTYTSVSLCQSKISKLISPFHTFISVSFPLKDSQVLHFHSGIDFHSVKDFGVLPFRQPNRCFPAGKTVQSVHLQWCRSRRLALM